MYAHPVVSWPLAFSGLEFIELGRSSRRSMSRAKSAQRIGAKDWRKAARDFRKL
jgi:hypothetical protein